MSHWYINPELGISFTQVFNEKRWLQIADRNPASEYHARFNVFGLTKLPEGDYYEFHGTWKIKIKNQL